MKNLSSFLRENWLIILVLLIPFPIIALYWNQWPEQIPIHWNINGEVDGYASKTVGIFLTPVLNILLFFFLLLVKRIDPKRENYHLFMSRYRGIRFSIHLFILGMFVFTILTALAYPYDFNKAIQTMLLLLLLILGNYMATVRPNYFVGIRTPWTLANEEVWVKTHRLTGRIWVAGCLIMLAVVWLLNVPPAFIIGGIILMALIPAVYSYIVFQKIKPKQNGTN